MEWKPIKTAPKDGRQILLASVDADGTFGIRHGYYGTAIGDRCWHDIDGEEISPEFWSEITLPPGAKW